MNLHEVGAKARQMLRWHGAGVPGLGTHYGGARQPLRLQPELTRQELRHLVAAMVD